MNTIHCGCADGPLRLSRGSGHRRQGEPDHDDDHGQHARPDRGAAPRTCGAAPHLATVALYAVDHFDRTLTAAVEPAFHSGGQARSALVSLAAMRRPRGLAQLACALVACVVVVGVIAAVIVTKDGDESAAPTTGQWAPITVTRPNVPIIGGGIPVDLDPDGAPGRPQLDARSRCPARVGTRSRLRTSRTSVPSTRSSGIRRPGCASSSCSAALEGHCTLTGLKGFGGNQFPTVVLYPNVLCDKLDLKPPSCTCLGDGGAVTISFVTDKEYAGARVSSGCGRRASSSTASPTTSSPGARRGAPGEARR